MPLIKHDAAPVSREELDALRLQLREAQPFHVLERDERRLLFLRSPRADPDPISDLEECLERVPDWATVDVSDVFIMGDVGSFHVPGHTVQPLLARRRRLDDQLVLHIRAQLDQHYGTGLHRLAGDVSNVVRLGVRIPRRNVSDLNEADLVRIARAAGPMIASGEASMVRLAYLVADEDHVRLQATDFFADITPRWEALQEDARRPAPTLQPEPARPAAAPRRPRPKKVLNVRPAIEVEARLDAVPSDEQAAYQLGVAEHRLDELLQAKGFDVLKRVQHDETTYALAAERAAGFPKRLLVKTYTLFRRDDAETMLQEVRRLEADILLVVACHVDDDARRRTIASKVKVISPDEVAAFHL